MIKYKERFIELHWSGVNHVIYNENAARYTCNSLTGFDCMDSYGGPMITNTR